MEPRSGFLESLWGVEWVFLSYLYLIQDFFGNANLHLIFFKKSTLKHWKHFFGESKQTHSTPHEGFIFIVTGVTVHTENGNNNISRAMFCLSMYI